VKLYNSVLDWSCCSLSHHLVPASTDNASRSPTLVGRTLPRWFRGSKFGSGPLVLTWHRVGAPLPDVEIQLLWRNRRTWWQHSTYMHCPSSLSYFINSRGIRFFSPITEVGCAFQNQVFSLSDLLPMLYLLPSISKRNLRYLGCTWYACCLLLASYDCLTLPGKARKASMRVFALSLPYSPCSLI
jgi:hypothetical protein